MRYTQEELEQIVDLHIKTIDGIIPFCGLQSGLKELFGEDSAQYRNAKRNQNSYKNMIIMAKPDNGYRLPANWAEVFFKALVGRKNEFNNFLEALEKQYTHERSMGITGRKLKSVIEKWRK